jgi:predicted  nucleic acid-binding Zn-ribbon protein
MPHITKRTSPLLFAAVLVCVSYLVAQQNQQSVRTQTTQPRSSPAAPQPQSDVRDQLAQLQMQVKDLQTTIDDLKSEWQMIEVKAKETHELVLDNQIVQKQDREQLNSLARAVDRNEKQVNTLAQQVSSMMSDLRRVKTKVGLY